MLALALSCAGCWLGVGLLCAAIWSALRMPGRRYDRARNLAFEPPRPAVCWVPPVRRRRRGRAPRRRTP